MSTNYMRERIKEQNYLAYLEKCQIESPTIEFRADPYKERENRC